MSSDEAGFKRFVAETAFNGQQVSGQSHLGEDVIRLIKDFLAICKNVDKLLSDRTAVRADFNNTKAKLEAAKQETRQLEKRNEDFRTVKIPSMVAEIKVMTTHLSRVSSSSGISAEDKESIQQTQAALKNLVNILIQPQGK